MSDAQRPRNLTEGVDSDDPKSMEAAVEIAVFETNLLLRMAASMGLVNHLDLVEREGWSQIVIRWPEGEVEGGADPLLQEGE